MAPANTQPRRCASRPWRILALDHDPDAVRASQENAVHNGVGERIEASLRPLANVQESFDVVVANILAVTLEELAVELLRITRPKGVLLLSGVLLEQLEALERAFMARARDAGRSLERLHLGTRGDWIAVAYRAG